MAASSFPTDERAVVALFIARIVFSVSQSLFSESLSLSLLSLLALSAEISVDASSSVSLPHFFKTRTGASSGIFLGAVTLPGVMISKLIQMSRAVSLNQSRSEGWYTVAILLWLFSHGLAAVKLTQNIFQTFLACASIGEALLVTVGLVIYFGDMLACTAAKSHGYFTSSKVVTVQYGNQRSEVSVVIQGLIIDLLLYAMLFKCLLQILERVSLASARDTADNHIRRSCVFYISLACVLIIALPSWMQFVQDFHMAPFSMGIAFCSVRTA